MGGSGEAAMSRKAPREFFATVIGEVYTLHFVPSFKHAKHYTGWAAERTAQSGRRLGAQVLVTTRRPTHYEGVTVRCSRVQSPRFLQVQRV